MRSIEMQVALPRVQDAGKLQEQLSKQSKYFQESLTQNQLKQDESTRNRVGEFEKTSEVKVNLESHPEHYPEKKNLHHKDDRIDHPYLGKKIDFIG